MPNFTFTESLRNIYPLLKCSNLNYLKLRVGKGETSRGKVREIVGLLAHMKKSGCTTYLIKYEESLLFSSVEIEGGHGLILDINNL